MRIVFNDEAITEALQKAQDSSIEIDLLSEILDKLNSVAPDPNLGEVIKKLASSRKNKPRFKMFKEQKKVSFPEISSPHKPSIHNFKEVANDVARIAKKVGLIPGKKYELEEAKTKLNQLRVHLIKLIDKEISKYGFEGCIPYLIERVDALVNSHELKIRTLEHSLEHEVDYSREVHYAREHDEFVRYHKSYRYLIEKFVQLKPKGARKLSKDGFKYLVALADKILEIYGASDSIHYEIYPVGMYVNDDYLIKVEYGADLGLMNRKYGEEDARINLGIKGREDDRVNSPRPVEDFLDVLDKAFVEDLGFSLRSLVNVLQILSLWAGYADGVKENTFYSASRAEIIKICVQNIQGIEKGEVGPILDFLTLRSTDLVTLVGREIPEDDIPVWEHRKRHSRYNLRPLIPLGDKFVWGPYSAWRSSIIWAQNPLDGQLPYEMESSSIQSVVREEKQLVENALVDKTEEVVKRFTAKVGKNVYLHKRDSKGGHPDIGDYDTLAYFPDRNIVLSIEDKDILPSYCLKDTKGTRESIFGKSTADRGYLGKVERREEYLRKNLERIAEVLGWDINTGNLPKIISLFVTRRSYWWTKFPPRHTKVKFLRIDALREFINNEVPLKRSSKHD